MRDTCIPLVVISAAAVLLSGCSSWEGPRAKVEDRRAPGHKTMATSKAPVAKVAQAPSRKVAEKPQPEEVTNTATDIKQLVSQVAGTSADAVSSGQVVEMKPARFSSR